MTFLLVVIFSTGAVYISGLTDEQCEKAKHDFQRLGHSAGCGLEEKQPDLPQRSIRQRLQPEAQGDPLPLGCGLVRLPVAWRNTEVYTHAGRVFQGWPAPWSLILHGRIMYSQISVDNPS
jgi:hypothetical protein